MARGQPDYGMYAPTQLIAGSADMAELAVRLGSIVTYDRRGNVVYMDDYEAAIQKYEEDNSPGSTSHLDGLAAVSGAQSVRLLTSGLAGGYAGLHHYIRPLVLGRHGIKISTNWYRMTFNDSYYQFAFALRGNRGTYLGGIRFNPNANTIAYLQGGVAWVIFENSFIPYDRRIQSFHDVKLAYDLDTHKYVRLLVDTESWDLSAYDIDYDPTPTFQVADIAFQAAMIPAVVLDVHQDDFVYTVNEP